MTITELRKRLEDLSKIIKEWVEEQGSEKIKTKDGKTLEDLKEKIVRLEEENKELKKNSITKEELIRILGGENNFNEDGTYIGDSASSQQGGSSKPTNEGGNIGSNSVTREEFNVLVQELNDLRESLANINLVKETDLKKEFSEELFSTDKTDLQLDEIKPPINPDTLNKALKVPADKKIEDFPYPSGLIIPDSNPPLNMQQWFDPKSSTSKFIVSGVEIDNSFDNANPVEDGRVEKGAAVKSAPTGGGKSTTEARCLAFRALSNEEVDASSEEKRRELGVTIVVPEKSLVDSVSDGHNDWLSNEQAALENIEKMNQKIASGEKKSNGELYTEADIDRRVIECQMCGKKHTAVGGKPYETVINGESNMINVFFFADFLWAYVNNPSIIKKWVIFDESHLKIPVIYRTLITCLIGGLVDNKEKELHRNIRKDKFSVLLLSATYPKLPTSKQLTSPYVTDYYITDFTKVAEAKEPNGSLKHPNIFKNRKLLIFADKPEKDAQGNLIVWKKPKKGEKKFDKMDVELLEKETKVVIANNALRPYFTGIIRDLEAPLIVVLSSAYEMGFSFGDVDCVTTGCIVITIVVEENGKWVEKEIEVSAEFYNWLQQRGRVGRDALYIEPVWMSITKKAGKYPPNELKKDVPSKLLLEEFDKKSGVAAMDRSVIKKIVDFYNQDKSIPELDPKEGNMYLNIILIKDLKSKLSPAKLFNVSKEEKDKVEEKKKALIAKANKEKNQAKKEKLSTAASNLKPREPGEYIFENDLMKYFREDQLEKILKEATNERMKKVRESEVDLGVFTDELTASMAGFLASCRDKKKYEVKVVKNSKGENIKLIIKFKPYKKIKEGTQVQLRELPKGVIYEQEEQEVWRDALFEIPPKDAIIW